MSLHWVWWHCSRHSEIVGVIGDIKLVDCAFAVPLIKYSNDPRITTTRMLDNVLLYFCIYTVRNCYEPLGIPKKFTERGYVWNGWCGKIKFRYPDFQSKMHISITKDAEHFVKIKRNKIPRKSFNYWTPI